MSYRLLYSDKYIKCAKKFLKKHPELIGQYEKVLRLLEIDPFHNSLRLYALKGKLEGLYSISINMQYRISLEIIFRDKDIILINIGDHDWVY